MVGIGDVTKDSLSMYHEGALLMLMVGVVILWFVQVLHWRFLLGIL